MAVEKVYQDGHIEWRLEVGSRDDRLSFVYGGMSKCSN